MIRVRNIGFSIVVLVVLTLLVTSIAYAQDPDAGKVLWEEQTGCQRCHGLNGEGVWGAPLAGNDKTAEEWIAQVRNPRRAMPAFSEEQVSDQMIIDMNAYMTSLSEPAETGFQDAGLPDDAPEGQQLIVAKRCVACHGITGPVRPFEQSQRTPTAEAVIAQLRNPKQFMPSFREDQVSDEEAALIADFLASQIAPTALPQSGSENQSESVWLLLLVGSLLLVGGFTIRRIKIRI